MILYEIESRCLPSTCWVFEINFGDIEIVGLLLPTKGKNNYTLVWKCVHEREFIFHFKLKLLKIKIPRTQFNALVYVITTFFKDTSMIAD